MLIALKPQLPLFSDSEGGDLSGRRLCDEDIFFTPISLDVQFIPWKTTKLHFMGGEILQYVNLTFPTYLKRGNRQLKRESPMCFCGVS